ncbi:MAG: diaminopropionate ammonia-lyase [Pseudomonadota bacterium]
MRVLLRSIRDRAADDANTVRADEPLAFHRRLPGYWPTPLIEAPDLAKSLGVGQVLVKNETSRFDLPSFKVLGASWATYAALAEKLGPLPDGPIAFADLRHWVSPVRPLTLIAATDGNHGRAVARVARWLGVDARIYLPNFVEPARQQAIESEGADVVVVDGLYDASVDAALDASNHPGTLLISDTARTSSDPIPKLVTQGYGTIFAEVDQQLAASGDRMIDTVAIQAGVGGLSAACTGWARSPRHSRPTQVAVVEPETAACVMTALAAGEPAGIAADEVSAMNVLQCGTISLTAFETLREGVSCCLAVEDEWASTAASCLEEAGVATGLSGAAGLAGFLGALSSPMAAAVRGHLGLTPDAQVLVVATEAPIASKHDLKVNPGVLAVTEREVELV